MLVAIDIEHKLINVMEDIKAGDLFMFLDEIFPNGEWADFKIIQSFVKPQIQTPYSVNADYFASISTSTLS